MASPPFFESAHSNEDINELEEKVEDDGQNLDGYDQERHTDDGGNGKEKAAGEPAEQECNQILQHRTAPPFR